VVIDASIPIGQYRAIEHAYNGMPTRSHWNSTEALENTKKTLSDFFSC
jgi:hypothetical protein